MLRRRVKIFGSSDLAGRKPAKLCSGIGPVTISSHECLDNKLGSTAETNGVALILGRKPNFEAPCTPDEVELIKTTWVLFRSTVRQKVKGNAMWLCTLPAPFKALLVDKKIIDKTNAFILSLLSSVVTVYSHRPRNTLHA